MQPIGMGNAITPFWLRLPKVFAYPLSPSALVYILILSSISSLIGFNSIFKGLLQLVILVVFCRYAYAALENSAQGHLKPPDVTSELVSGAMGLPFKQLLVFFIMGFAVVLAGGVAGPLGMLIMGGLVYIWMPASVMELATSHSLMDAINPFRLTSAIRAIGWPYALLWLFLLMLSAGSNALQSLLLRGVGGALALFVFSVISMYFLLAMFHLMGYVIYQYHESLGYPVIVDFDSTPEAKSAQNQAQNHPVLNQIAMLLHEGKSDEARRLLKDKIAQDRGDLELRKQYHKLLLLSGEHGVLIEHAQSYLTLLLADKRTRPAAELVRDCQSAVPDFKLTNPDHVYPLMQELKAMREAKQAVRLAQNFHQRHPKHADLPAVYLLAAKTLCEDLRQDIQARKILHFLATQFPHHALSQEIRQYQMVLEQLSHQG